jgi:hypothetical protein
MKKNFNQHRVYTVSEYGTKLIYTDTGKVKILDQRKPTNILRDIQRHGTSHKGVRYQNEPRDWELKQIIYGPRKYDPSMTPEEYSHYEIAHQKLVLIVRDMKRKALSWADQMLGMFKTTLSTPDVTDAELDSMKLLDFGITREELIRLICGQEDLFFSPNKINLAA